MKKFFSPWPNSPSSTGEPRGVPGSELNPLGHGFGGGTPTPEVKKDNKADVLERMNRAVCCLSIELPPKVWDDVVGIWNEFKAAYSLNVPDAMLGPAGR